MNTSRGTVLGLPIDEAVARMHQCAAALSASVEKVPSHQGFGERISGIVRHKAHACFDAQPRADGEELSFGQRIAEAVKRRNNASNSAERSRYRLKPRRHTLSD